MEFGLNTKQQIFNPEIEKIASSIKKEFKIEVNRIEFITEFCNLLEEYLNKKLKYVKGKWIMKIGYLFPGQGSQNIRNGKRFIRKI